MSSAFVISAILLHTKCPWIKRCFDGTKLFGSTYTSYVWLSAEYWPKICFDIRFNNHWLMVYMNSVCGFGSYTLMNFISTNRCFYLPHSGSQSFVTIKNNINHKDKRQIEDTDVIVTKDYWVFWTDFDYHPSDKNSIISRWTKTK